MLALWKKEIKCKVNARALQGSCKTGVIEYSTEQEV